jgi:hypothetical protein
MSKKRYDWIMAYHFSADYPSEQMWQAAFKKFCAELAEFDKKEAACS